MPHCRNCEEIFEIGDWDRDHISRISPVVGGQKLEIPAPTLCPDCRLRRRLAHHNERKMYRAQCSNSGKNILSIYSPDKSLTVYEPSIWWGDNWDPLSYGRAFDPSRSFFEQFAELRQVVPRMSVTQERVENSTYTSCVSNLKNCYLLFTSDFSRDCGYGIWTQNSRDCFDTLIVDNCELAYECIFSDSIYSSSFILFSSQCTDSVFLFDCRNCKNCCLSYGLRNKQYCIENVQYSKEEYAERLNALRLDTRSGQERALKRFEELRLKAAHLYMWRKGRILNSTGDLLHDTENCNHCFEVVRSKDCKFSLGYEMKNALDVTYGNAEFGYEMCECFPMPYHSAFNVNSYSGTNLYYCDLCMNNCSDCFGCVGLKQKRFCILNKQYTEDEYNKLLPRVIAQMSAAGEWGEFFPIALSNFSYNETLAQDYFPLSEEQAREAGYSWLVDDGRTARPASCQVPDAIGEVADEITDEILSCSECQRNYRLIKQELLFYRKLNLPIPQLCFECRYARRRAVKNPRKLWQRSCVKCTAELTSPYAPERSEDVYCEECYLEQLG